MELSLRAPPCEESAFDPSPVAGPATVRPPAGSFALFLILRNNALVSPALFHILLGLRDETLDAEGIVSRMRAHGRETDPPLASFYRALKRALDEGYLEIIDREDAPRRGRPRQRYRITRSGRTALASEARRLGKLSKLALGAAGADRE